MSESSSLPPDRFPGILRNLRNGCSLTQVELAEKATDAGFPLSLGQIALWEQGEDQVTMKALFALLDVFDVRLEAFDQDFESRSTDVAPDWNNRLPGALRSLRQAARLTQAEAASRGSVSEWRISRWENGRGNPTCRSLFSFLEALGADPYDLADALTSPGQLRRSRTTEDLVDLEGAEIFSTIEHQLLGLCGQVIDLQRHLHQVRDRLDLHLHRFDPADGKA